MDGDVHSFNYLRFCVQKNVSFDKNVKYKVNIKKNIKIKCGGIKWRNKFDVLGDDIIPMQLKGKFYKSVMKRLML